MKAYDLFSVLTAVTPEHTFFFVDFTRYEPYLLNPLKSENGGDKGSSRSNAVNGQMVHI